MGLDQYGSIIKNNSNNTDFSYNGKGKMIAQWRKHPNLQGWMENLFNFKATRQGFIGIVESGGILPGITATAISFDKDGNKLESISENKELEGLVREALESIKEQYDKIIESSPPKRVFNNQPLRLNLSDLEQLETAINRGELPKTKGFYFGDDADKEYKEQDIEFIVAAREAISKGYDVYYDSWW
jgi:hypothetical protein